MNVELSALNHGWYYRDPRGFAVKFYTEDGIWDLVGNNTPIFFIRDPLLFPVFIHTQKRNPATHLKVTACIARVIFPQEITESLKKNPLLQFSHPNFGHRQDISDDLKELIKGT
jgi:hypothetical protein